MMALVEVDMGLVLGIPSIASDVNYFKEETAWGGLAMGNARPVKATIL